MKSRDAIQQARLNVKAVPKMVGRDAKVRFRECMALLEHTNWPLYLTGPSGSGKSIMAMNLAKAYARQFGVQAYYVQLSPEQTKTSLILGLRLIDGSLRPVRGVVAEAMRHGGVIVVEEATHTTQELLLMFNSILDRTSVTSIGEEVVYAKPSFRAIFTANSSRYAGNVRLPQSFAQRLAAFYFDYPCFKDEVRIAARVASSECDVTVRVPKSVYCYLTSFIREVRTERFPLSVRNVAAATVRLSLAGFHVKDDVTLNAHFTQGTSVESIRRTIARRVHGKEITDLAKLNSPEVVEVMRFVSSVNLKRFREIVLSSCMYYLDVDGIELSGETTKTKLEGAII